MTANLTIVVVVVFYMAVLLGIGYLAGWRMRSTEDFFLAGRSLGSWVSGVSSTASSESGWVMLGAVGMAYTQGVSALWFAPGCLLGYVVNLYWLAPRLRREAARQGSLTIPDFLSDRFGDPHHLLRLTGVLIILLSLGGYLAAQMTAVGKAMHAILGVAYGPGIAIAGSIIVVYTLMGGFRAVCWTDLFQGLIMAASLVAMPILALSAAGGYGETLTRLAAIDPGLVSVTGSRTGFGLFGFLAGLLGIGLGYPGQPHVITRYMAASGDQKIRQIQVIAMVWGVIVFWGAGLLGLAGRLLMPELGLTGNDPEELFPLLAMKLLHPLVAGIMLAAILSAIMSTVSSQLLVVASAVSRDLFDTFLSKRSGARASIAAGRIAVLAVGVIAMGVATQDTRVVFWFVLFAWSGLGAAFGPVLLLALFSNRLTRRGALAGMVTGFGVTVAWKLSGLSDAIVYELVPAFALATLAALAVSGLDRRRNSPPPQFAPRRDRA